MRTTFVDDDRKGGEMVKRRRVDAAVLEIVAGLERRTQQLEVTVCGLSAQVDQVAAAHREFEEWNAILVANGDEGIA